MSRQIISSESEVDFKEPLSPSTPRTGGSRVTPYSSTTSLPLPPPPTHPSYGLMGGVGVLVSILIALLSRVSDAGLAYALWLQFMSETEFYRRKEEKMIFVGTLVIILAPLGVINFISLVWYIRMKSKTPQMGGEAAEEGGAFGGKSRMGKVVCVTLHLMLLGAFVRYIDLLRSSQPRRSRTQYLPNPRDPPAGLPSNSHRLRYTPSHEQQYATYEQRQSLSKDTALLDLLLGFLKEVPQVLLQIFLIYRSHQGLSGHPRPQQQWDLTLPTQLVKILVGLVGASWSLAYYQDELRRLVPGQGKRLTCGAASVCLFARLALLTSRLLAIASFAALQIDSEGGLLKAESEGARRSAIVSFPSITAFILLGHWFLMLIWIHAQKASYRSPTPDGRGGSNPCLDFLYALALSWVHIFCYLNLKATPSRRKMVFFYALVWSQNTVFMIVWYMQLITTDVWLRVVVIFATEALFFTGLSCVIGYYAFLRPNREDRRARDITEASSSWRLHQQAT